MGRTNLKRLLCLILSLATVFALAVAPAYAAEETNAETVETEEPSTDTTAAADNTVSPTAVIAETEESVVDSLQAQIDALPTVDEVSAMDADGQMQVYEQISAIWDTYYTLSEDEAAQINIVALEELSDYFTSASTADEGVDEGVVIGPEMEIPEDTVEIQRDGYTISAPSIGDLIDEVEDGDTITLIADTDTYGTVTIPEGTTVTIDLAGYTLDENITNKGVLTITDSSDTGGGAYTGTLTNSEGSTLIITGGTYSFDVSSFVAEGYISTLNDDNNTYTVAEKATDNVASVTTTNKITTYTSLAAAFAAAAACDTVTLLDNVTLSEDLSVSVSVTFDLAGFNLTIGSENDTTSVALTIGEDATVIIVDQNGSGVVANYGTITVNGTLDARDLGYTTDASAAGGLLGQTSGKISIGSAGTFIVPDVWNTMWSSLGEWEPNWTSATSASGILTSAAEGAMIYTFGTGWKCSTAFNSSGYDSNTTYWDLSGTYLVEYYKTSRGGEDINVNDTTTWTYPEAVVDGTIFAGWYEDAHYNLMKICRSQQCWNGKSHRRYRRGRHRPVQS
ncbi:MAG: hypothetical protein LUG52_08855 [Clostridia bacterium]|nr:hypothetical protein [Clostridia bacterium]